MTNEEKELLYDLLAKKAVYGLDADEERQLNNFDPETVEAEFRSFELAATAISMASLDVEPMPEHLFAKILEKAPDAMPLVSSAGSDEEKPAPVYTAADIFDKKPRRSILGWLGWGVAAVLFVVLSLDVYYDRIEPKTEQAKAIEQPTPATTPLSPAEQRDQMLRSAPDMITAAWAPGNMKDMQVSGDIVWSDAKQAGYMRFRGLPPNDPSKATYQLWIFDQTQDKATPIDGGTFDVSASGEVIVPINAKLHAVKPAMFAVTMEKPGGVVVSKREKIAALAQTQTSSS